jgi:hypothetical protein
VNKGIVLRGEWTFPGRATEQMGENRIGQALSVRGILFCLHRCPARFPQARKSPHGSGIFLTFPPLWSIFNDNTVR